MGFRKLAIVVDEEPCPNGALNTGISHDFVDSLGFKIILEFLVRRIMERRANSGKRSGDPKQSDRPALEHFGQAYGVVYGEIGTGFFVHVLQRNETMYFVRSIRNIPGHNLI